MAKLSIVPKEAVAEVALYQDEQLFRLVLEVVLALDDFAEQERLIDFLKQWVTDRPHLEALVQKAFQDRFLLLTVNQKTEA